MFRSANRANNQTNNRRIKQGLPSQHGSALVIAIFIIIVMTLIGVGLMKMLSTTSESIAYEVLGTRAYHAGQSGLQWQLHRTFPVNGGAPQCFSSPENRTLTGVSGLSQCEFTVTCESSIKNGKLYYAIHSIGRCADAEVVTTRKFHVDARGLN